MNIQLFLADQELELNDKVSFPLNKTYENLSNPTDIIVEYSKSINIPMTSQNNRIFANAYRLDKKVLNSNYESVGMYLNPSKRIPFKMIYNGTILLEGYAKFVSASYSNSNKYYTINLFGAIGEVFQELLNVVTDSNKLNGLDSKYVLNDYRYVTEGENELTKSFVRNCWEKEDNLAWVQGQYDDFDVLDMYGFAPSHRGFYNNFKSDKIQISSTKTTEIAQHFRDTWDDSNDLYGADNIVGEGFTDYQMNQFNTNRLKPYVYFNHIMRMYVDKCKDLTGYEIVLDETWFNRNNPYWAKLCYMLDFLDLDVVDSESDVTIFNSTISEIADYWTNTTTKTCRMTMKDISVASDKSYPDKISIDKFNIGFGVEATVDVLSEISIISDNDIKIVPATEVYFTININRKGDAGLTTVSTLKYWTNGENKSSFSASESGYTSSNFVMYNEDKTNSTNHGYNHDGVPLTAKKYYYVTIPSFIVNGEFAQGYQIDVQVKMVNNTPTEEYPGSNTKHPALYKWTWRNSSSAVYVYDFITGDPEKDDLSGMQSGQPTHIIYVDNTPYIKNWGNNMPVDIANLYQNEEPLFKVILEYTKMFGLVWDVDYNLKKIYIKTRQSLFRSVEYVNWTDKLDRSKDMKIEPITFDTKAVMFNYNNANGYRYSSYRDKYGINIGEKKLYTGYEFNTTDKKLFDNIDPSSVSSKTYVPFNTFLNWNKADVLIPVQEQRVLIDAESEDEKSAISINNWYFRGPNIVDKDVLITIDSPYMVANKEYCYMDRTFAITSGCAVNPGIFPTFSTAIEFKGKTYGMFFNTPNVDYTHNKLISNTINANIYDLFWRRYINEKYNVANKKVTAYFNLTNVDYNQFRFNKLVILDNQLFIVNKIIDFNINNIGSTKCELIQVNDLSGYTNTSVSFT